MRGQLLKEFSSVVEQIYASATAPASWPETVRAIAMLHHAPKATLLTPSTSPMNGVFIFPFG